MSNNGETSQLSYLSDARGDISAHNEWFEQQSASKPSTSCGDDDKFAKLEAAFDQFVSRFDTYAKRHGL